MKIVDEDLESIIKGIIDIRKHLGWSQSELAKYAGLTASAISLIEKGGRSPSLNTLLNISRAFNMPLSELVTCDSPFIVDNAIWLNVNSKDFLNLNENDRDLVMILVRRLNENC